MGVEMVDAVLTAMATALATKGAEAVVAGARGAWDRLARLIRERLDGDDASALADAEQRPDSAAAVERLASALARVMAADPRLDEEARALWARASSASAADGGVVNQVSGHAERVVQARDVFGDISF